MITAKTAALAAAAAVLGIASMVCAESTVSNVSIAQRPDSRLVDITYDLGGDAAIITLSIETNGVAIPDSAVTWLYDDVCKVVQPGNRSILWNAGEDWPENMTATAKAHVTAWSIDSPPLYCAVDLTGGILAGAYSVYYYASAEGVPRGVNNDLYKTDRILMRRLTPTGSTGFNMGEGAGVKQVILTHGFYAGVFQVTQKQWQHVMGDAQPAYFTDPASRDCRPMEQLSYNDIRGAGAGAGWPADNSVDAESFVGRLRMRTKNNGFDLPTEAQWEYACRAGTDTCFNDGNEDANVSGNNTNANEWLDALGRYKFNGGYLNNGVGKPAATCGPANGTAIVGSYLPNAWGLYDMHGNVWEWCRDWFRNSLPGGTDPGGPTSGSSNYRVRRGGRWDLGASYNRSADRYGSSAGTRSYFIGFRLMRTQAEEIWEEPAQQQRAEIVWTKVLCKQPGRYLGWATVCARKDGELLATFSGDRDGHVCPWGKVQMVRSVDGGATWSSAVNIANTPLDDRDAGIIELPNGDLVVSWFTSIAYQSSIRDRTKLTPGSSLFNWWLHQEKLLPEIQDQWLGYYTIRSIDGGKSWEPPVRTIGATPHGPIALQDGRLLYVGITHANTPSMFKGGEQREITVAESLDQARSWQQISVIPLPEGEKYSNFYEPHVVETADGRLVAQIRYHGKGRGKDARLWQSESADGGATWSVAQSTDLAGFPPHLLRLRNGKLISAYGRRFEAFGEYACISDDHGRTWDVANEIKLAGHFDGDLGYPASAELADGSILTVYYQAENKGEKPCLMGTLWRLKE